MYLNLLNAAADSIATTGLNRAEDSNALNVAAMTELNDAVEQVRDDSRL